MKIAIIGANGFIGRNLTHSLSRETDHELLLFGRGKASAASGKLPYTQIDLSDRDSISYQFSGIDLVYYLASESIPATTWDKPLLEVEMNLIPFVNFIECICRLNVKKVAFVSSAGTIYGPSPNRLSEEAEKKPFSPYGITKLAMENYLNYFEKKYGLRHDIFRVSNVYGSGQDTSKGLGIINTFLEKIISEGRIHVFGDGENIRNYVFIKDVAGIMCMSAKQGIDQSGTYNLASDDTLSINQLIEIMRTVVKEPFEVTYTENRASDNTVIIPDNTKIKRTLPQFQFTGITEGIKQTYLHLKEQVTK